MNVSQLVGPRQPASLLLEQPGELLDHRAAELVGVHDRHRAAIIAGGDGFGDGYL